MRTRDAIVLAATLAALLWESAAQSAPFDYDPSHTSQDGYLHLSAGTVIAASVSIYTTEVAPNVEEVPRMLYAAGFCAAAGAGKEIADELTYGGFSEWDLAATLVGCGTGVAIGSLYAEVRGSPDMVSVSPRAVNLHWRF